MQRRPKKSNPKARKPPARNQKEDCPYCGQTYNKQSMTAHFALNHPIHLGKKQ